MQNLKRILMTGGCGFIGSNLIALLHQDDSLKIRVLDNESLGKREYLADFDVEFIKGELTDLETVERSLVGVDAVVHLAADTRVMDSIADPRFNFQSNVIGTFGLMDAMRRAGVAYMINASTGGAILGEVPPPVHEDMVPKPESPYGASKLAVEGYLSAFSHTYGMKAVSLRFSNVYGPLSYHKGSVVAHFFKQILKGEDLTVYGDGAQTRDYVYVQDVCRGIVQALTSGQSGVFQLGTGIPTTINELIDLMAATVGSDYKIEVRYQDFRPGEIAHTYCDISKAQNQLGYDPSTKLADGLAATWEWFKDNWTRIAK